MADGGLVFIDNQGPLVRIDACGNIAWITDGIFHHSLETDLDGNLVAPLRAFPSYASEWMPEGYRDDSYATVSPEGEILAVQSTTEIMLKGGLLGLMHTTYPHLHDYAHLNDVQIARTTTEAWQRGDVVLSQRQLNLILLWRPSTREVVWWKTGPWLKQHDPDFLPDGTISIFSNDVLDTEEKQFLTGHSSVYVFDPISGSTRQLLPDVMAETETGTLTQGRARVLADGSVFIEETDAGRLIRDRRRRSGLDLLQPRGPFGLAC